MTHDRIDSVSRPDEPNHRFRSLPIRALALPIGGFLIAATFLSGFPAGERSSFGHSRRAAAVPGGGRLELEAETGLPVRRGPEAGMPDDVGRVRRLDSQGQTRWTLERSAVLDLGAGPSGGSLLLSSRRRSIPALDAQIDFRDDYLTLVDPAGTVLREVSLLEAARARPEMFPGLTADRRSVGGAPWIEVLRAVSMEWIGRTDLEPLHPFARGGLVLVTLERPAGLAAFDWDREEFVWFWDGDRLLDPQDASLLPSGNVRVLDGGSADAPARELEVDPRTARVVRETLPPGRLLGG